MRVHFYNFMSHALMQTANNRNKQEVVQEMITEYNSKRISRIKKEATAVG